jgi:hypothetical protein
MKKKETLKKKRKGKRENSHVGRNLFKVSTGAAF